MMESPSAQVLRMLRDSTRHGFQHPFRTALFADDCQGDIQYFGWIHGFPNFLMHSKTE